MQIKSDVLWPCTQSRHSNVNGIGAIAKLPPSKKFCNRSHSKCLKNQRLSEQNCFSRYHWHIKKCSL